MKFLSSYPKNIKQGAWVPFTRFTYCFSSDSGWIRVGKLLCHWKRTPPLFSERNGYKTYWRIPLTKWRVRLKAGTQMTTTTTDKEHHQ